MSRFDKHTMAKGIAFLAVSLCWIALDRIAKNYFEGAYQLGQRSASDYGLFDFVLVHNRGAAWGMFDDSTFALGILSLVVCLLILVILAFYEKIVGRRPSIPEVMTLALVFGGGVGNAIDRFAQGFVVDFINFTFIDFPVFNIADIGVTCGFVLFILSFLISDRKGVDDNAVR